MNQTAMDIHELIKGSTNPGVLNLDARVLLAAQAMSALLRNDGRVDIDDPTLEAYASLAIKCADAICGCHETMKPPKK
jgi:hypothetical protein